VFAVVTGTTEPTNAATTVHGHLVRWVADRFAWLGEAEGGVMFPRAVSCDGFAATGEFSDINAGTLRWTRDGGYEALFERDHSDGRYIEAMSNEGTALFGLQMAARGGSAMKWQDERPPEVFAELPPGYDHRAFSRGGDAFRFQVAGGTTIYVKVGDGPLLEQTLPMPGNCADASLGLYYSISTGARVTATLADCGERQLPFAVVWTEDGTAHLLPETAYVRALTPAGVAVGTLQVNERSRGYVWGARHGLRYLEDVLAEYGVDVPSTVHIQSVSDVSDDSRVFTGVCVDAREPGRANIFRAVLPAGAFD